MNLKTLPVCQGTSRNPTQLGAEIYGHTGVESDLEILQLMVEALTIIGLDSRMVIDIGHVGIYRGLAEQACLSTEQEQALFNALQRKALPEIKKLLSEYALSDDSASMLLALSELNGDMDVLIKADQVLGQASASVKEALQTLKDISSMASQRLPKMTVNFDLAELRGYDYHTGLVFAAYQSGSARALAMGGRYDGIGEDFGHAQPATGFSLDLKDMVANSAIKSTENEVITAQWCDDAEQHNMIHQLRENGETVVYLLSGTTITTKKVLVKQNSHWVVVETGKETSG